MDEAVDIEHIRGMLLTFASHLAKRCVEVVNEGGLAFGAIEDCTDAGGLEWHFKITYDKEDAECRIAAHPHRPDGDLPEAFRVGPFAAILGGGRDEDAFDYKVPVAWLP